MLDDSPKWARVVVCCVLTGTACAGPRTQGSGDTGSDRPDPWKEDNRMEEGVEDRGVPGDPPLAYPDGTGLDPALDGERLTDLCSGEDEAPSEAGLDLSPTDAGDAGDPSGPDPGPPAPPPRPRITVNAIPDPMNGTIPYTQHNGPPRDFRLRVPTRGFTIEVYRDDGAAPGLDRVRLFASTPVHLDGETLPPGEEVAGRFGCGPHPDPMVRASDKALVARCMVPEGALDPTPSLEITAFLESPDGIVSEPDSISVEVAVLEPVLDPFETPDVWLVTLSRDLCDHRLMARPDGTYDILTTFVPGGNGTADLDEALTLLGLLSDNTDFSEAARSLFLERVREYAHQIFGLDGLGQPTPWGVPLYLFFEGDPGAPDPATWSESKGFSMIALGGDPKYSDIAAGIVGRAWLDWNNQRHEDNTIPDFGVFVTSIVRQALRHPLGAMILREISPLDGTPLGRYPGDEHLLEPNFDPTKSGDPRLEQRHAIFKTILDFATLAVAATLCHEMGHSLGLVPNGPPPKGLFGGMDGLSFTDSDAGNYHIDTPGLNVMQTGKVTSYLEALGGVPRFNELNLAYLRRRLVVGPTDSGGRREVSSCGEGGHCCTEDGGPSL